MEPDGDDYNLLPPPSLPAAEIRTLAGRLLNEEQWEMRAAAAKELGQRGDLQAVEPLCIALTDRIWHVRMAAVGALGRLKDARAVEPLCSTLQDTDFYVRVAATVALMEIGDRRAVQMLCWALEDTESLVRSSAADALGRMEDVWAIEALCKALNDPDSTVRRSAAGALDQLGTAYTLPLRVLAAMTLTPAKLLSTLQVLREAAPRVMASGTVPGSARKWMRYAIGDVQIFCERICERSDVDESFKRGAEAVLAELRNRADSGVLLRASAHDATREKEELLRGVSGSSDPIPPEELLRASDTSSVASSAEKPGLLARIFKRK